ncbi:MAG TPA: hypothetical protein VJH24_03590 [Candidatus Bilamarchaeaceae archaeon]|nr:hypothetical protein [Candidatus Bilamarchaeaceae archaeon]
MQFTQSLLRVPHAPKTPDKRLFFGQLLVETKVDKVDFAKEVANAIIIQAESNRATVDYTPDPDIFVTRIESGEHVLQFEGDLPAYLKIPPEDARSFHVSFREATAEDGTAELAEKIRFSPTYVLTLSMLASSPSELGDRGFWGQLGTNLYTGLSTEGSSGRPADGNPNVAIVYGDEAGHQFVLD